MIIIFKRMNLNLPEYPMSRVPITRRRAIVLTGSLAAGAAAMFRATMETG